MATLFGDNATLANSNVPSEKVTAQEYHGRVRRMRDTFTLAAEVTSGDIIEMGPKLPANAQIIDAEFNAPAATSGTAKIGWAASADGGEAADDDALYDATDIDISGALARLKIENDKGGYEYQLSEQVQLQIEMTANSVGATGDTWELVVYYVVD